MVWHLERETALRAVFSLYAHYDKLSKFSNQEYLCLSKLLNFELIIYENINKLTVWQSGDQGD